MDYDLRAMDKLANEFKKRDNPKMIGHIVGDVVETNPIKVSVLDGQAFFSGSKLTVGDRLNGYTETVGLTINGITNTATIEHFGLKVNDKVICQFTNDNQNLIVLDKVS